MPDPIIFNFDNPSEEEIQRFIDFSNNPDELDNPAIYHLNASEKSFFGLTFPLTYEVGATGFFPRARTLKEQAKSNLQNLLLTTPGERVFQPNFGSQLKSIVFEQGQDIPNRVEEAIRTSVDSFSPHINIINVFTIQEQNQVNVQVEFSVPLNPEDIEVLNFDFRIGE